MARAKTVCGVLALLSAVAFAFAPANQSAQQFAPTGSSDGHGRVGVYLTSYAVTKASVMSDLYAAREAGLVDAVVINVKNMHGEVTYASQVPLANTIGAAVDRLDVARLLPELRARGFYLIARQVLFYDPILASYLRRDGSWVPVDDPTAIEYNLAIAEEVTGLGFDELQFDYIRYPDGGAYDPIYDDRYAAVERFVVAAAQRLAGRITLSADLFGRVLWPWNEKRIDPIGQSLETMSVHLDFVSPMLYPSHYVEQAYRDDPYRVIRDALAAGAARVDTDFRPYLQAFDRYIPAGMSLETYISEQVRAAEELGANGMLFWHPACEYAALYRALN